MNFIGIIKRGIYAIFRITTVARTQYPLIIQKGVSFKSRYFTAFALVGIISIDQI